MSSLRVTRRPALDGREPVRRSSLSILPGAEGSIIHVLAAPGAGDIAPFLRTLVDGALHPVRALAPEQWFIVTDKPLSFEATDALFRALEPQAAGVDQSHGRVRIHISGPGVERVLSKGTAVDPSLRAFPVGHSAPTLIGHISALLTRLDAEAFELIVLRGFAESLWDDLVTMSADA